MNPKNIITILAIILILTACTPTSKNTASSDGTVKYEEYRTGNQGLRITFITNMPPARVFDTDELNAVIEVENLGAFKTKAIADRIYLSGFDPAMLTGIKTTGEPIPQLEGKTIYTQKGTSDRVAFKGIPTMLSAKKIDKYPIKMLATACYEYETLASANICIDPNPYSTTAVQKVCTPASVSMSAGQGGPIAVTNVQVEPAPGITRLKIDIANTGGGEVFKPGIDTLQKCSPYTPGLEFDDADYVHVDDISMPGYSIINTCRPIIQENTRLVNGKATIYCEINTLGQPVYTSPLTIKLSYGYRTTIFKNIELVSI
jgi:hypothetical protein